MLSCSKCGIAQPPESFYRDSSRPRGYVSRCKTCSGSKYLNARDKYRRTARRGHVRRKYGLGLEDYDARLSSGCAVCGSFVRLGMDHSHATNSIREPLCGACNSALGAASDDPAILRSAAAYIEAHSV